MVNRFLGILVASSLMGVFAPSAFDAYRKRLQANEEAVPAPPAVVEASHPPGAAPPPAGRTARLLAGADGHFSTEARMNGRLVPVLVDTGATYVAISRETARRLGVSPGPDAFRYRVRTANGEAKAALATLSRVEIGPVAVDGVEALVMEDLPTSLLGMSFLSRLQRFEVTAGRLDLTE